MRYLLLIAGDEKAAVNMTKEEGGAVQAAYFKYTEELKKAGILLGGEGLMPSATGARVQVTEGKRKVTDGPFSEAKELIGGFYLIQVKSKNEAIEWAARCPGAQHNRAFVEVREVMEFGTT